MPLFAYRFLRRIVCVVIPAAAVLVAVGCSDEPITEYITTSDSHPVGEPWVDAAGGEEASGPVPRWDVPAGWEAVDSAESARAATFAVDVDGDTVEIAVTQFPGDVGGMVANVNRWRGQVGLESLDDAAVEELVVLFDTPGFEAYEVRLDGPQATILAAGLFEPLANRTWFVRSLMASSQVEAVVADFRRFTRSFAKGSVSPAMRDIPESYESANRPDGSDGSDGPDGPEAEPATPQPRTPAPYSSDGY